MVYILNLFVLNLTIETVHYITKKNLFVLEKIMKKKIYILSGYKKNI